MAWTYKLSGRVLFSEASEELSSTSRIINLTIAEFCELMGDAKRAHPYFRMGFKYFYGEFWLHDCLYSFLRAVEKGQLNRYSTRIIFNKPWPPEITSSSTIKGYLNYLWCLDQEFIEHYIDTNLVKKTLRYEPYPRTDLDSSAINFLELAQPGHFEFDDPAVFEGRESRKHRSVPTPKQGIYKLENIQLLPAFQILTNKGICPTDPSSAPRRELVAGIWQYYNIGIRRDTVYMSPPSYRSTIELKRAILLSGRVSENYMHFLIEYLPRVFNVEQANLDQEIPLLIQAGLPKQLKEALGVCTDRPFLELDPNSELLKISELWVPTIPTFHGEIYDFEYWKGGALIPKYVYELRKRAYLAAKIGADQPTRKIYLSRRSSQARSIVNAREVEEFLQKQGFEIIRTENFSFLEQVMLFSSANIIIGPAGAALANVIFCKPKALVVGLINTINVNYSMKANLANLVGADFIYLTGEPVAKNRPKWVGDQIIEPIQIDMNRLQRFFDLVILKRLIE